MWAKNSEMMLSAMLPQGAKQLRAFWVLPYGDVALAASLCR